MSREDACGFGPKLGRNRLDRDLGFSQIVKRLRGGSALRAVATLFLVVHSIDVNAAESVRDVVVGNNETRLSLPESYIDSVVGARQDGQVLLHVRWPDLTGYHDDHERDHSWDPAKHGNLIILLLTLSSRTNLLEDRYERQVKFFAPLSRHPSIMGLEHWGKDLPPGALYTTKVEVYFVPGERIETYLTCYLPGTIPYPSCTANFYVGPFLAKATYSRVFLPDWKLIEDGIRQRVLSFIQPSSKCEC